MFEIQVKMISPVGMDDLDRALVDFLSAIGYIKYTSRDMEDAKKSVGYRLFRDCFLRYPDRAWGVEELIAHLNTTRPTLYRYLNKLKSLDLLEEEHEGIAKRYRIRYGDLRKAWSFVEANVKVAMDNYRQIVERISEMAEGLK